MWTQMQKMLQPAANHGGEAKDVPVIPLRKSPTALEGLDTGKIIRFRKQCPLAPLSGALATIIAVREYRFGDDVLKSYQLQIGAAKQYFLTIAEDDQGQYLSIARALDAAEQDIWFGRDALGFFTEPSSAKSIRCKADLMIEGEWAAARYSKTVDWVEGTVAPAQSPRLARMFHYNLLVNEAGDKALEIEHEDSSGDNRIYITVYRPIEDIAGIEAAIIEGMATAKAAPSAPAAKEVNGAKEVPLFKPEPVFSSAPPVTPEPQPQPAPQPKQRQDFRRLDAQGSMPEIHIERTPASQAPDPDAQQLPAFLLTREDHSLAVDQLMLPEAERVRVGVHAARTLIEYAVRKNVRVRDVLRNMLGLKSALSEEVIFEMPLTDEDYRTLSMRYKLRPDHRIEIRARLEEELRQKLAEIA